MADIMIQGNPIHTCGTLPAVGTAPPDFELVNTELKTVSLATYAGKKKVLNIFPSIDTPVCATSVRRFNKEAAALDNTVVLCVSADLPFANQRFCGAEGIDRVEVLSTFRGSFGTDWQVEITDGPFIGLCSRAIVILDENNTVIYAEQVPEIAQEPNYTHALAALKE